MIELRCASRSDFVACRIRNFKPYIDSETWRFWPPGNLVGVQTTRSVRFRTIGNWLVILLAAVCSTLRNLDRRRIDIDVRGAPPGNDSARSIGLDIEIELWLVRVNNNLHFRNDNLATRMKLLVSIKRLHREPVLAVSFATEFEVLFGNGFVLVKGPGFSFVVRKIQLDFDVLSSGVVH